MHPTVAAGKALHIGRAAVPDSSLRMSLFVPVAADNQAGIRQQWAAEHRIPMGGDR
jgi:hypothetical protein